jgi:F-type H+-transporting ATPase subunit gamma
MPSLRQTRKRIKSVRNTQKLTKAMKMVSAAKLRKAQERLLATRPYAHQLRDVVARLAARVGALGGEEHPLLRSHDPPRRIMLVVVTSDRGLAGSFNSNITRRAERFLAEEAHRFEAVQLSVIGRKGRDHFRRTRTGSLQEHVGVIDNLVFPRVREIAESIVKAFTEESLDACFLLYNEFKSAVSQLVVVEQLLPIVPAGGSVMTRAADPLGAQTGFGAEDDGPPLHGAHLYEPSQDAILDKLLRRYCATELFRALLESVTSEHGARMTAMDNATKNAAEMADRLTLQYNRARQGAITKELMEIIGGAEALK